MQINNAHFERRQDGQWWWWPIKDSRRLGTGQLVRYRNNGETMCAMLDLIQPATCDTCGLDGDACKCFCVDCGKRIQNRDRHDDINDPLHVWCWNRRLDAHVDGMVVAGEIRAEYPKR